MAKIEDLKTIRIQFDNYASRETAVLAQTQAKDALKRTPESYLSAISDGTPSTGMDVRTVMDSDTAVEALQTFFGTRASVKVLPSSKEPSTGQTVIQVKCAL